MLLPQIPRYLLDRLSRGQCVLFVGAGLSREAGLPGWQDLLLQMVTWCDQNCIVIPERERVVERIEARRELLDAADSILDALTPDQQFTCLERILEDADPRPTDTHKLLPALEFSAVVTTNYDKLLEAAYTLKRGYPPKVFTYRNVPELSRSLAAERLYILKAHGSIDDIESIVLGRKRYNEIIYRNEPYREHLRSLFSTKTILFVGFNPSDPDLELLTEGLCVKSQGYTGTHYALMDIREADSVRRKRLLESQGIQVIGYTPSSEYHPEVGAFLLEIGRRLQERAGAGDSESQRSVPGGLRSAEAAITASAVPELTTADGSVSGPEAAAESQVRQVVGAALRRAEHIGDDGAGEPGDVSDLTDFELARLQLLTTMWVSRRTLSSALDTHQINLLYLHREEVRATPRELFFILRMLVLDPDDYAPGWFWLREPFFEEYLLLLAALDPYEHARERALTLLAAAKLEPPDAGGDWVRDCFERLLVGSDSSPHVRLALVSYLGVIGGRRELDAVGRGLVDDDAAVRQAARNSKNLILARIDPARAVDEMVASSEEASVSVIAELSASAARIPSDQLFKALDLGTDELKILAMGELRQRGHLAPAALEPLLKDASNKVRDSACKILIDLGARPSPEEIRDAVWDETHFRQYGPLSAMFRSSYSDPDALVLLTIRDRSAEELCAMVDWYPFTGVVAYKAVALYHFSEVGDAVRSDLRDDFKRAEVALAQEYADTLESLKVTSVDGVQVPPGYYHPPKAEDLRRMAESILFDELGKSAYVAAALSALAAHGCSSDVSFARHHLSNEEYDVRVEAVNLLLRFGDASDLPRLLMIAEKESGLLQELAVRAALRIDPGASASTGRILRTGDKVLIGHVVRNLPRDASPEFAEFLEALLYEKDSHIRLGVLAYLANVLAAYESEALLGRYLGHESYFYDVVCWLDRLLYAPTNLRRMYKAKLGAQFGINS